MDDLIGKLRLLKGWPGRTSYDTITKRINAAREEAGIPERASRSTVADCFRIGRPRPDDDLLLEIVAVLHPDDPDYVDRWRQAIRVVRGEAEAAAMVRVEDRVPDPCTGFTMRAAMLDGLAALGTRVADAPIVIGIEGLAGTGKTELAYEAARRLLQQGRFDQVLVVNLRGFSVQPDQPPVRADAVLDGFLRKLGVAGHQIPHDLDKRVKLYRDQLSARSVLVLLDNAANAEQVKPLLPDCSDSIAIITSRRRLTGIEGLLPVQVSEFTEAEAMDLFRTAAGASRFDAEPTIAGLIAELLGNFPLALGAVAGRISADPSWTLTDHLDRLVQRYGPRTPTEELSITARRIIAARAALHQPLEPQVEVALRLSYDALTTDQRRLFRLLALHPGADLDDYAAAAMASCELVVARQLLGALVDNNLLRDRTPGRMEFHDVVRAFAIARAHDEERGPSRQGALAGLLAYYRHTAAAAVDWLDPYRRQHRPWPGALPSPSPVLADRRSAVDWLDMERANLLAATVYAAANGWIKEACALSAVIQPYLYLGGHYRSAVTVHTRVLEATYELSDPLAEAHAHARLSSMHRRLGDYPEALAHGRRSLAMFRAANDLSCEAEAQKNIGLVYQRQGRYQDAIRRQKRVQRLARKLGDRLIAANALGNLANIYDLLGHYEKAAEHYARALIEFRELGDRVGEGKTLDHLGILRSRMGQLDDALRYHQEALQIAQEVGDRAGAGDIIDNVGSAYRRAGDFRRAREELERALEIRREVADRAGEGITLDGLGIVHALLGDPDRARDHYEQALAIASELGNRHLQARAHNGLAEVYQTKRDFNAAASQYELAFTLSQEVGDAQQEARARRGLEQIRGLAE